MNKCQFINSFTLNHKIKLADAYLGEVYERYYASEKPTSHVIGTVFNAADPSNVKSVLGGLPL